jgi:hypothetical protein
MVATLACNQTYGGNLRMQSNLWYHPSHTIKLTVAIFTRNQDLRWQPSYAIKLMVAIFTRNQDSRWRPSYAIKLMAVTFICNQTYGGNIRMQSKLCLHKQSNL